MDRRIQQLEARVEKLERELARNSGNSSRPPSSDPPGAGRQRRSEGSSGRSPGAQPGHEGRGRELLPAAAVDEVVRHWPAVCGCGHVFAEAERVAIRASGRDQVEELPRLAVRVVEHQRMRVRCPACGNERTGELPAGIGRSAFGRRVRRGRALNVDETGWRLKGERRASWGAFTDTLAVYRIAPDRHEREARELLAGHAGVVTSDRWWAYNHLPAGRRQICWAHLRRDFQAHAEGLAAEKEFGQAGLDVCDQVFWAWEIYQHTGDRRELRRRVRPLRRQPKPLLRRCSGKAPRYRYTRGIARNLLKVWPALWTFAERRGVQPTNNHAERALRGAVIYRKL